MTFRQASTADTSLKARTTAWATMGSASAKWLTSAGVAAGPTKREALLAAVRRTTGFAELRRRSSKSGEMSPRGWAEPASACKMAGANTSSLIMRGRRPFDSCGKPRTMAFTAATRDPLLAVSSAATSRTSASTEFRSTRAAAVRRSSDRWASSRRRWLGERRASTSFSGDSDSKFGMAGGV